LSLFSRPAGRPRSDPALLSDQGFPIRHSGGRGLANRNPAAYV